MGEHATLVAEAAIKQGLYAAHRRLHGDAVRAAISERLEYEAAWWRILAAARPPGSWREDA